MFTHKQAIIEMIRTKVGENGRGISKKKFVGNFDLTSIF